jgi:cysteine-rich repeat protein
MGQRGRTILATAVLALTALAPPILALCGNGIREGNEQCDGTDTGGLACENLCFDSGRLACAPGCVFDTSGCALCGNDRKETGEACDGTDLGGWACPEGGVAACYPDCFAIDERGCFRCGNGILEGQEACDVADFGCPTCNACTAPGETGGELACTAACAIDRTPCWRCGNGRVDPGEECDDGELNGTPGDGCSTACARRCGDGVLQSGEQCDDGNRTAGDGCSADCNLETGYGGGTAGDSGAVDLCMVDWSVAGLVPGPTNACADGAACDQDGAANGQCGFQVWYCTNVSQSPQAGPVPCRPTDLASIELASGTTLDQAARTAFLDAMAATLAAGGGTVARAGSTLTVTPATTARGVCGGFVASVPRGSAQTIVVDARDSSTALDHDQLALACQ